MNMLDSANKAGHSFLGLSGSALKVIALVSMLTDHSAYYLLEHETTLYEAMRSFGRIAFPVFAFLIAEGFSHTRNRLRYFLTLLGFAVASEVPWLLLNGADGTHNVMFTLALGVGALAIFEKYHQRKFVCFCMIALIAIFATCLGTDYEWRGISLIVICYMMREHRPLLLLFMLPLMIYYGIVGAIMAAIVLSLYDGTRGFIQGSTAKYGFYAFYPVHLFLLGYFSLPTY
ncbi:MULTISPECIES: TraX family protein [Bacteroidales]|uniref:TraX family protein n=1 Tax=Bacteroidales TaxID=171549 RepID=UPI001CCA94DA|nr:MULTISPECIES: TraX family protein [Bacteroidales]UBD77706.1 conjugal transfer protein TraX [Parabacteroides goldsteinii]